MSHNVETMMYSGKVPWHGLGTYVGADPILGAEALELSGLDWTVAKYPLYIHTTEYDTTMNDMREVPILVDNQFALVREHDKVPLGIATDAYSIVQNSEALSLMDSIAGPDNLIRYHTAGSLKGGRIIWLLAELTQLTLGPTELDETKPFICLANHHDGTGALRAFFTSVRVVCNNTFTVAVNQDGAAGVSIRHRGNIADKMLEARRVLGLASSAFEVYNAQTNQLYQTPMNDREYRYFGEQLITSESTAAKNVRDNLFERWLLQPDEVQGTRWAAFNSVTEYTTHDSRTRVTSNASRAENMFTSNLTGTGSKLANKALELLTA